MSKKPGKKSERAIDPKVLFDHASKFLYADEYILRGKHITAQQVELIAQPSMVISAFTIELFLKCILLLEEQEVPDIHSLSGLFKRISHKRKRRIDELWERHARPFLAGFATSQGVPTDLSNALFQCSLAFQRLRYAYETNFQGVKFYLGDLPRILRNVILEIKPEWGVPTTLPTYPNR
jgi:hypothetical protein